MPKVSVIVPVYNVQRYLRGCLDSILAQTMRDLEVVCVNDGSTDASRDIIEDYLHRDPRVRVVDKANAGYGAGINDGFAAATGEWLTILEPDDLFPHDACQLMYEACVADDLDFLKADASVFWGEGQTYREEPAPTSPDRASYEHVFDPSANPGARFSRAGQPGMYRASFIRDKGIRLHESAGASFQDTGLWAQCMFVGTRARFLDRVCYLIRRDNPDSSEKDRRKVYTICDEWDFIRSRIDELSVPHPDECARSSAWFRFRGYRWNLDRIASDKCLEFLERFSADFRKLDEAGELDRSYFEPEEVAWLQEVMASPELVYWRQYAHRDELEGLRAQVGRLVAERDQAAAERDKAVASRDEANRRAQELQAKVDEVYASHSYQVGHALLTPLSAIRHAGDKR